MIEVGKFYTMGRCKSTGDRSYSHNVWLVYAHNETHAVIRARGVMTHQFGYEPEVVLIGEFDWTDATELLPYLREMNNGDAPR